MNDITAKELERSANEQELLIARGQKAAPAFVDAKRICGLARQAIEAGCTFGKTERVSDLVIRQENDRYFLAAYITSYTQKSFLWNNSRRPSRWILMDFVTGAILEDRTCEGHEFSRARYDKWYSIKLSQGGHDLSEEYYRASYAYLDSARISILEGKPLDKNRYKTYLERIVLNMPKDFARMLFDLNNIPLKTIEKRR